MLSWVSVLPYSLRSLETHFNFLKLKSSWTVLFWWSQNVSRSHVDKNSVEISLLNLVVRALAWIVGDQVQSLFCLIQSDQGWRSLLSQAEQGFECGSPTSQAVPSPPGYIRAHTLLPQLKSSGFDLKPDILTQFRLCRNIGKVLCLFQWGTETLGNFGIVLWPALLINLYYKERVWFQWA